MSVRDFFFIILFRAWVIYKNWKRAGIYTLTENIFIDNSKSKQNKKNPESSFLGIAK